jgi:phosphatidylglycerol lysyltransferase
MDRKPASVRPVTAPADTRTGFRLPRVVPAVAGLLLFAAALAVLDREVRAMSFRDVSQSLAQLPAGRVWLAVLLTIANYVVLTLCDQLAFVYLGKRISRWRIALASFVGYSISNSVGFALFSGTSARYRFYSRWGLSAQQLGRIVLFYSTTFWLGLLVLGGWSLIVSPPPGIEAVTGTRATAALGGVLLVAAAGYALWACLGQELRVGRWKLVLPAPRLVASQFVLSTADWLLAVAVLHALLPDPRPGFVIMVSAFLAAQLLGLASNVPGGLGVFESLMVLLLRPTVTAAQLLPALVAFRLIYYVLPLAAALVVLIVDEIAQRRHQVARWKAAFGSLAVMLVPRLLAVFTFLAGALLLFSGATPAAAGRLAWLTRLLPLPVLEVSHFAGSLVGLALLLVSRGIARRLDASYYVTVTALAIGIVTSLLKGADYEEAVVLTVVLAALFSTRAHFDRKAAALAVPLSPLWTASVAGVLLGSWWLGMFAFRHVEYSNELWWRFEANQEASRFLRASVGVVVAATIVGLRWLLRPLRPQLRRPSEEDLAQAGRVIDTQTSTSPYLVYLRDKAVLWNEARTAFLMYARHGRTWVALHDPVGPKDAERELIARFLEECDDFDAVPVFYEVKKEGLHNYADFGLTFAKLGEEARVDLHAFSLDGPERKGLRTIARRLERDGGTFRIVEAADVHTLLPELREISDEWLTSRAAAEKRFSLGFFLPDYLCRFPLAVIEQGGVLQAFVNVWPGPGKQELSLDLMRHRTSAPKNVADALLIHLMLWGREQGYRSCALGMAPLAGLDAPDLASLWNRFGSFVYRHGEAFYNFQGVREFKDKYNPSWDPRYLVYPGGLSLPKVVADVAALVAGGYPWMFLRRDPRKDHRLRHLELDGVEGAMMKPRPVAGR